MLLTLRRQSREFVAYCFFCVLFTATTIIQVWAHRQIRYSLQHGISYAVASLRPSTDPANPQIHPWFLRKPGVLPDGEVQRLACSAHGHDSRKRDVVRLVG